MHIKHAQLFDMCDRCYVSVRTHVCTCTVDCTCVVVCLGVDSCARCGGVWAGAPQTRAHGVRGSRVWSCGGAGVHSVMENL